MVITTGLQVIQAWKDNPPGMILVLATGLMPSAFSYLTYILRIANPKLEAGG